jgi:tRNA nucleotidyltransferase (CCA-adding enzyme)
MTFPARLAIPDEVLAIARRIDEAGHEVWCVGGAVRDALLGDPQSDVDLATSATPDQVQALFPRRTVAIGVRFGTVGVLDRDRRLHEVTTFRRDVATDGRHAVVAYGVSLEDDLARRDLTINAIAYHPLRGEWRDPFDGAGDLERGLVRAVGEPAQRFREDYLRILRALRFAARLDFRIDEATWAAMVAEAPGLARLSAERVREEWRKGLGSAREVAWLVELWHASGAARVLLPELVAADEAAALLGLATVPPPARDDVLLTILLLRDPVGVLRRLRASNAEIERARQVVQAPRRPDGDSPPAVRRWLSVAGSAADDVLSLWHLRHGADAPWAETVRAIRQRGEPLGRADLAVNGDDLRAAGVPAGPALGAILDRLLAEVLERPALNEREALLARARELL